MQIPEGAPVLEGYTPFVVSWWKEHFVFHMISDDGHRMAVCWWNGHDVEFTEKRIVANLLSPIKMCPETVGYCPLHGWYGCNEKTHREG